jgi:hypothetical protein
MEAGEVKEAASATSGDVAGVPAGAHLDAPAARKVEEVAQEAAALENTDDELADACRAGNPRTALVGRGVDRIPVQLTGQPHLELLKREHGEDAVEILS